MNNQIKIVSSLEKIFPTKEPVTGSSKISMLKNDTAAFQVAVYLDQGTKHYRLEGSVSVQSPIGDFVTMRKVETVPVRLPGVDLQDGNYLSDAPGMYPDLLRPIENGKAFINLGHWTALWVTVETPADCKPGCYPITITVKNEVSWAAEMSSELSVTAEVEIIDAVLPAQELKHTEWFYCDCLADYYKVEVWGEEHWRIVENFVSIANKRGVNMLLTPLFTPALDTVAGGERTTTQLVDICLNNGAYGFNFDKFIRWVEMGNRNGIQWFEMAHFFTQWGAKHCPKIMATVDGEYKRIFGWESEAGSKEYRSFLEAFIPALIVEIDKLGIRDRVVFHVSDEPHSEFLEHYKTAKNQVQDLLEGFTMMDALSDYAYYEQGLCELPVVATNHVTPFLEGKTPEEFWVYYCVSQGVDVSNRFIAMPSARNRIIGTQFFKYDVAGFLHWGFNFYNGQYSLSKIDPFSNTDSDGGFPSGDPFFVYPGKNGEPISSIRLEVFWEALCDLRAFRLLESLTSKEFVMNLIEKEQEITFFSYPKNAEYLLSLREKINTEIAARIN